MRVLLVVYDDVSYIRYFPHALAYIAAVLKKHGHDVEVYSQDLHHWPDEHLTDYLDRNKFDVLGISLIAGYFQYKRILALSRAINKSKNRPVYVLGGHGPTPEPEFFFRKTGADVIVQGEGENTIIDLLECLGNKTPLSAVSGIAYREGEKVFINPERPLIQDLDTIPFPAYEMFPIEYYRLLREPHATNLDFVLPLISARGCPFTCNFCYRIEKGIRGRKPEYIVEEVKLLQKDYGITYINFDDELFMYSTKRTTELCEAFLKADLKFKWSCNGRLNLAKTEILELMKRAGCVYVNYGIEAMDDLVLKKMNKCLTTDVIIQGVETTLKVGISPGLNILWGNLGEDEETLQKGLEFLLKYDDHTTLRTIRPVTPYPGSPLYYIAIKQGLLKDVEDFYENKHLNSDLLAVNFTALSDDKFHQLLFDANIKLIENWAQAQASSRIESARKLYLEHDASFRGFRQT